MKLVADENVPENALKAWNVDVDKEDSVSWNFYHGEPDEPLPQASKNQYAEH